jgi:ABC-2 type transport system permease protein
LVFKNRKYARFDFFCRVSWMLQTISAAMVLAQREWVRFLRQRNRVIGALATPIVFWGLIGSGMGRSFSAPDAVAAEGYLSYFFPGTLLMILLFTAIFSTISIIEDRREGFLQGVLVAPVGRTAIVLGKVIGGAVLATGQAIIVLLLGLLSGVVTFHAMGLLASIGIMFLTAAGLTSLGLCIAWRLSSTQGFHAIMNLFLMPMWMLSGALFPVRDDTPQLLKLLMLGNPLTYALTSLRSTINGRFDTVPTLVALAATVIMTCVALRVARTRSVVDADV